MSNTEERERGKKQKQIALGAITQKCRSANKFRRKGRKNKVTGEKISCEISNGKALRRGMVVPQPNTTRHSFCLERINGERTKIPNDVKFFKRNCVKNEQC